MNRLLLLALTLFGCGTAEKYCTEIGCSDSALVTFDHAWSETGTYSVEVSADGQTNTCTGNALDGFVCDDGGEYFDAPDESVDLYQTFEVPQQVEVVVSLDGVTLVSERFDVDPELTYPNGESCDPVCASWETTIVF